MASFSASSQDLRSQSRTLVASSSSTRRFSRSKDTNKGRCCLPWGLRLVASLTAMQNLVRRQVPGSSQSLETYVCSDPPVTETFTSRKYNGKSVRDVLMDTHDLINEPGGFVINLSHHGHKSDSKDLRIHLGIREKSLVRVTDGPGPKPWEILPGTLRTTDDYARDIFRAISSSPELETLVSILEIKEDNDSYDEKFVPDKSPEFLEEFIQTYPMTLTTFHVEMPGISAVYLPEWKFLLDQQFFLKKLICNFGVVLWTFYEDCIIQNSETLERVTLRRIQTFDTLQDDFIAFNWQLFSDCTNLQYLKITCGYKFTGRRYLTTPLPPSAVFIHENLDDLPTENSFKEFHLGHVWVNPCILERFCAARPHLKICGHCKDLEYQEGYDEGEDDVAQENNDGQLVSPMIVKPEAELSQDARGSRRHGSQERQLAYLLLAFFHIILMALAILFIIIYFRHLRSSRVWDLNYRRHV